MQKQLNAVKEFHTAFGLGVSESPKADLGAGGTFYSADQGEHWIQLDADATLYTLRFLDKNTFIAAGKNQIVKFSLIRGK